MEKKKIVTPKESMCSSRTFEAANISFSFSFFFFFLSFLPVFFSHWCLCFRNSLCCMRRRDVRCSCFFLDWLRNHHALECERGRMWADVQFVIRNVHTHFRLLEETPPYYHPHREGGTSLTSPGGHLTSFSQSGILLKPTVATAAAGHVFKRFSS